MAYIKFKELSKYFDFKTEVEKKDLPFYVKEYVYENEKIVMLDKIMPVDILSEGHRQELVTYKGVMVSSQHSDKDMFKINLLNMIQK